jgi:hypothetical protein
MVCRGLSGLPRGVDLMHRHRSDAILHSHGGEPLFDVLCLSDSSSTGSAQELETWIALGCTVEPHHSLLIPSTVAHRSTAGRRLCFGRLQR